MISIKNKIAFSKMETAGLLLSEIFEQVQSLIAVGISTYEIDFFVARQLKEKGLISEMKGYAGYKYVTCISLNDEVVHGIPSKDKILKKSDLVKLDVCASWKGYCADMARCFFVDDVASDVARKLVYVAQSALDKGIKECFPGNKLGNVSASIQKEVESNGFGVVRDFAGHGIGKSMHEDPEILNYGFEGQGIVLREGMAFALEPMITVGSYEVHITDDRWTVKTDDGSLAAHVEDTVFITAQGPKILTRLESKGRY